MARRANPRPVRSPEAKARQLAGLRKGNARAPLESVVMVLPTKPLLTEPLAADFVKLLLAGVTPIEALRFLQPAYWAYCNAHQRRAWLTEVQASSLVADETDRLNEGAWQDIEAGDRLRLALEKHYAEMAYFLYTNNFADPSADRAKMTEAREAIVAKIEAGDGKGGSVFDVFLQKLAGRADLAEPPRLPPRSAEPELDDALATVLAAGAGRDDAE